MHPKLVEDRREAKAWLRVHGRLLRQTAVPADENWLAYEPELYEAYCEEDAAERAEFSGDMFPGVDYHAHMEVAKWVSRPLWKKPSKYAWHSARVGRYGGVDDFTRQDWERIKEGFGHVCAYCERRAERLQIEHVEPLSKGGDNAPWNIVPACGPCNSSKRTRVLDVWCEDKDLPLDDIEARIASIRDDLRREYGDRYATPAYTDEGQAA